MILRYELLNYANFDNSRPACNYASLHLSLITFPLKGGESSSQFRWLTIAKIELLFLIFFVLILGLRLQRYFTNTKRYPPKNVFVNSEFCSSRQNHSRRNSLGNCGFGGKNKTQNLQKLFSGDIFLYLLNIFVTAVPRLKQKISKIIVQF